MKIALISPYDRSIQHRVRGTGSYFENLKKALLKIDKEDEFAFSLKELNEVDLVHYPYFEPFFITLPLKKKNKYVVTVHDLTPLIFPNNFPRGIKGNLKWQIQKILLKNADAIITDSNSSKKDILKLTGVKEKKIKVIYLAAGENFVVQKDKINLDKIGKKYNLPKEFVLYVGDVTWNKNLPRLIEAINKTGLPLVMAGKALKDEEFDRKNPWNADLARVLDLIKKNDKIHRLGFVPEEDLISLYNLATLSAMPSLYEGFGLPILESMSCGCPVVATKEGSIPEVTNDAAFIVDAYDTKDIAEGILKVFKNQELRKELSEKGLKQAQKFSWGKTATETLELYKSL